MTADADDRYRLAIIFAEYSDARPSEFSSTVLSPMHLKQIAKCFHEHKGELRAYGGASLIGIVPQRDEAILAAVGIQKLLREERSRDPARSAMSGRIGVAFGEVMLDAKAPKGAVVQKLRAAVSKLPLNGLGISQALVDDLPPGLQLSPKPVTEENARSLALFSVSSGDNEIAATQMAPATLRADQEVFTELQLSVHGEKSTLRASQCPWLVGRDENCNTVLKGEWASRVHGRFEMRAGRFYYRDESANGSYVLSASGSEIRVHQEEYLLVGNGAISPGVPIAEQRGELLRFECRGSRLAMK